VGNPFHTPILVRLAMESIMDRETMSAAAWSDITGHAEVRGTDDEFCFSRSIDDITN